MLCKIKGGSVRNRAPVKYVVALPMHQNAEIEICAQKNKINKTKALLQVQFI